MSRLPSPTPIFALSLLLGAVLALTGCTDSGDLSSPNEPAPNPNEPAAVDAGDIVIAGQYFAHSIVALPEVATAPQPPLVQFNGITNAVQGPLDVQPYTELLRDRLLVGCRFKLVFLERQLPPLRVGKKKKTTSDLALGTPQYRVSAELRGNVSDDNLRLLLQFQDMATGESLFTGLYSIRKEYEAPVALPAAGPGTFPPPPPKTDSAGLLLQ